MDEPRTYVIPLVIWTVFVTALVALWSGLHPFAVMACSLWLVLAMIALLAQTSPRGRAYLADTLNTRKYTQVYLFVARRLNNWVWWRVGRMRVLPDGTEVPPPETTPAWPLLWGALTWRLLDRALLIAVAYPLAALFLSWLTGRNAVLGAELVLFPAVDFWPDRAVVLGQFVILTAGVVGQKRAAASARRLLRGVARWLPYTALAVASIGGFAFAVAGVGAGSGALAFTGAVALALTFRGVSTGAGTLALAVALAAVIAFAFAGQGAPVFTGAAVVAFAGAAAVAFAGAAAVGWFWSRGRQGWALAFVGGFWALTLQAVVLFVDLSALQAEVKALLVFLAVLPLVNGLYDTLSYAITIALSRKGLSTRWAPLWGLLDLALGAVLFLALATTMVAVVAALNAFGTAPLYDLAALFAGLRDSPGDYLWLYLILFSTLLPTSLHLVIATLAVQGWFVFQRPRRAVARWIKAASASHTAAVGGFLGQTMIWWLPLMALAVLCWAAWQLTGPAAGVTGLIYLDLLEWLSRAIGAI